MIAFNYNFFSFKQSFLCKSLSEMLIKLGLDVSEDSSQAAVRDTGRDAADYSCTTNEGR